MKTQSDLSEASALRDRELVVELYKDLPSFNLAASLNARDKPLGILGASGSGKSMTLRCIAGLETPSRGTIILNGRILFDSCKKIKEKWHQIKNQPFPWYVHLDPLKLIMTTS